MKRGISGLVSLFLLATPGAYAELTSFEVFAAFAPSGSSPSWDGYVNRAHAGIKAGGAPVGGDRNLDPTAYTPVPASTSPHDPPRVSPHELIVSSFNSWRGKADPSSFPSAAVENEFGNRIHFGTTISSTANMPFSLHDISYEIDSNDADDFFDLSGNFSGANYSPTRIGINYGPDNALGGGDDIVYDDGESGSELIHSFSYVGIGTAFDGGGSSGTHTDQEAINDVLRSILAGCDAECNVSLVGRYNIDPSVFNRPIMREAEVIIDIEAGFGGDFDLNGMIDVQDIKLLTEESAAGTNDILFDLNSDGEVGFDDVEIWAHDIRNIYFGDANVDGQFDTKDLIKVFQAAKYEKDLAANWCEGDWNGDGLFTSSDLVLAFVDAGYRKGPRGAGAAAVPEPASVVLLVVGLFAATAGARRRR